MANRVRDGFDFYSALTEAVGVWTALGTGSISATTRFGAGQSLLLSTTLNNISLSASFTNSTTLFLNFALMTASAVGAAQTKCSFRFLDAGTVQCSLVFDQDGSMKFYRGDLTTLLGTYAGAINGSSTWGHFQVRIVFSNTVGTISIRKNGATVDDFALTGLDNCSTANEFCNQFSSRITDGGAPAYFIDDFWLFDNTVSGGEPITWIGDNRAVQLMPNSDSAIALTRSGGATNFSNVDELINSAADYVFGTTAPLIDEYGNGGLAVAPSSILGVTVRATALKMDAGARTAGLRVRSGATVSDSPDSAMSTTAASIAYNIDRDPNTGAAWTNANLTAMIHGPRIAT